MVKFILYWRSLILGYSDVKEIFKDVKQLADNLKNEELNSKILDLQSSMMELASENLDMRESLSKVNDLKDAKKYLVRKGDFWVKNDDIRTKIQSKERLEDDISAYVYCPVCLSKDNKLVSVNNFPRQWGNELHCPVCDFISGQY